MVVGRSDLAVLALGVPASIAVGLTVLRVVHRSQFAELVQIASRGIGRTEVELVAAEGGGRAS
jgi:hypothetical protein